MTKTEWIDGLVAKRAARGYTEAENAEYRAWLEKRIAGYTAAEFATAQEAAAARRAR